MITSLKRWLAVLRTRNYEFVRDHSALGWNLAFPFLVIFAFGFLFTKDESKLFKAGYYAADIAAQAQVEKLKTIPGIEWVGMDSSEAGSAKTLHHKLDLFVDLQSHQYTVSKTSPKGGIVERLLVSAPLGEKSLRRLEVNGTEIRYVDWLIAGLLGMNMMFSALFGVGYNMVRYRKMGVLKRLRATPLRSVEFLSAQIASRFILLMSVNAVIFTGCMLMVKFQMQGSYWDLFVVLGLGAICLSSMGLLIAARVQSEEMAGGLLNLLSWPMMFMSGVWFSLEGTPAWVQRIAQVFPLTHVVEAARRIMTEGATLAAVAPSVWILVIFSVVFLGLGSLLFRWN